MSYTWVRIAACSSQAKTSLQASSTAAGSTGFVVVKEWPSNTELKWLTILVLCCFLLAKYDDDGQPFPRRLSLDLTTSCVFKMHRCKFGQQKSGWAKTRPAQPLATAMPLMYTLMSFPDMHVKNLCVKVSPLFLHHYILFHLAKLFVSGNSKYFFQKH